MVTMKSLGLDRLTVEERVALAEELWESVEDGSEPHLTPEQKADLDERLNDLKDGPEDGITWEELKAKLLGSR